MNIVKKIISIGILIFLLNLGLSISVSADVTVNPSLIGIEDVTIVEGEILWIDASPYKGGYTIPANPHVLETCGKRTDPSTNKVLYYGLRGLKPGNVLVSLHYKLIPTHTSDIDTLRVYVISSDFYLNFNANGGTCEITSQKVKFNQKCNYYSSLPTPQKPGYKFNGWYTKPTGGTLVTNNTLYTTRSNLTVYAQWTPEKYIVYFDPNGGIVEEEYRYVTYGSPYGTLPVPSRKGYTFKDWYTAEKYGIRISGKDIVNFIGEQVLFAHWIKNISAEEIHLNNTELSLYPNETATLTAEVLPEDATIKDIIWNSSNNSVATVDTNGVVTAIGYGNATITAQTTDKVCSAECMVTVKKEFIPIVSISVHCPNTTLDIGDTTQCTVTILPDDATIKDVVWSSSDDAIITVDTNGVVTAIGEGSATITVQTTDKSCFANCFFTVKNIFIPVENIYVSWPFSIKVGDIRQCTAIIRPDNATNPSVVWESDNPSIITVDQNGVIIGVEAGYARITAKTPDGSIRTYWDIKVEEPRGDIGYPLVLGDANGDYCVDDDDVKLYSQYFAGYPVTLDLTMADVNRDGQITRADIMYLARGIDQWEGYDNYSEDDPSPDDNYSEDGPSPDDSEVTFDPNDF